VPIVVPYHQDESLPAGDLPVSGDAVTPVLPDGDVWSRLAALYEQVAVAVAGIARPMVVSGDCLVSVGVLAGVQRAGHDPAVVWFDAHGDVHTLDSSTSGYLGGLALRLLLGAHRELLADRIGLTPLAEERALLVDGRDLDPAEVDYLAGSGIRRSTVDDMGALPEGPLLLHVDLDVIDRGDLPGLRFPVGGGPSAERVRAALAAVIGTGRVVAFDVACPWHPARPGQELARAALLAGLTELWG
jgi:arginase